MTLMPVSRPFNGLGFWGFLRDQFRPRGPLFTPFNLISVPVILLGIGDRKSVV